MLSAKSRPKRAIPKNNAHQLLEKDASHARNVRAVVACLFHQLVRVSRFTIPLLGEPLFVHFHNRNPEFHRSIRHINLFVVRRHAELTQRSRLNLANALFGDAYFVADFLER